MESETCLCKVQANRFGKIFALRFFYQNVIFLTRVIKHCWRSDLVWNCDISIFAANP